MSMFGKGSSGMDMLLGAVGIDPNEIMTQINGFMEKTSEKVNQINENYQTILAEQQKQRELLEMIYRSLTVDVPEGTTQEVAEGVYYTDEKFPSVVEPMSRHVPTSPERLQEIIEQRSRDNLAFPDKRTGPTQIATFE